MSESIQEMPEAATTNQGINFSRLAIWSGIGLLLLFLAVALASAFETQPTEGKAPDFTIETYDGDTITLSELEGNVVVVNFWASWCAPCEMEAPDLQAAWETYQDQNVMFIGVDYVDSTHKGLEFIDRFGITYPNGADLRSEISDAYDIRGVPETFVIDPQGEITFFAERPVSYEELVLEIDRALALPMESQ